MFDQGQDFAGHEPGGADWGAGSGYFHYFDHAAGDGYFHAAAGSGGCDLVGAGCVACVDDCFDAVAFHSVSVSNLCSRASVRNCLLGDMYRVAIYTRAMAGVGMSEQAFFVLTALVGEPRHGYGVVREVAELSDGRVDLRVGTLYGVLDRLTGDGLVELDREEVANGRLRRYYRITDAGRRRLAGEVERQAANARVAGARLRAWRPAGGTA